MKFTPWQQWRKQSRQEAKNRGAARRRRHKSPPLTLERLEERLTPVVFAFAVDPDPIAAPIAPGTGYDGVVIVDPGAAESSGSLLFTSRDILTAAHVVDKDHDGVVDSGGGGKVQFDMPGGPIYIDVSNVVLPPGWIANPGAGNGNDLAILRLAMLAPLGAEHYPIYRASDEIGQTFSFVGYGRTGTGMTGDANPPDHHKRLGQNTFDAFAETVNPGVGSTVQFNGSARTSLAFDFDNRSSANDALGVVANIHHTGLGNAEAMAGVGDSGGPSFINGQIAAVTSRYFSVGTVPPDVPSIVTKKPESDGSFGDIAEFTRVSAFAGFIDQTVGGRYDLVLDMRKQPGGQDNLPDTIRAELNGSNLALFINGQALYSDSLSQIKSLTIRGTLDQENITVASDLGIPVTVVGFHSAHWYDPNGSRVDEALEVRLANGNNSLTGDDPIPNVTTGYDYDPTTATFDRSILYRYLDKNENNLVVLDNTLSSAVTVTPQAVTVGAETISYTGFKNVTVTTAAPTTILSLDLGTGTGRNTFNVTRTPAAGLTLITGSNGDVVNVGDANTNLDGVAGLIINGKAGTTLVINDKANRDRREESAYDDGGTHKGRVEIKTTQTLPTYLITNQDVRRTNMVAFTDDVFDPSTQIMTPVEGYPTTVTFIASISYSNVESVAIQGGATHNVFNVQSTRVGTPVTITAGNMADAVNVGTPGNLLETVNFLTVHGGTGTTLTLNDQANAPISLRAAQRSTTGEYTRETSPQYQITDHDVTRTDRVIERDPAQPDDYGDPADLDTYAIVSITLYHTLVNYDQIASLVINGGSSGDEFNILSAAPDTDTTINAGGGNDTTNVSSVTNTTDAIPGPVTINGQGGTNVLNVNDQGRTTGLGYVIDGSSLTRGPAHPVITFQAMQSFVINAGSGDDFVRVSGTAPATAVTVNTGPGGDDVFLGNAQNTLDQILRNVVVDGQGNGDRLVVQDDLSPDPHTYTVTSNSITRDGLILANYLNVETLQVNTGRASDAIDVESTAAGTATLVDSGRGNDAINVGSPSNLVAPIQGPLTINGQDGNNSLHVNDQNAADFHYYDVSASDVRRLDGKAQPDMAPINYTRIQTLTVNAGGASAGVNGNGRSGAFEVTSTLAGTATILNGSAGNDQFNFFGSNSNMDDLKGPITLHTNGGFYDFVEFSDFLNPVGQTYDFTATSLERSGIALITWDPMPVGLFASVVGTGVNHINVKSVSAGYAQSFLMGTGDILTIGSNAPSLGGNLDNILGPVVATSFGTQTPTVIIDDSGDTTSHTNVVVETDGINGDVVTGLAPAPIYFRLNTAATLYGGSAGNIFNVQSTAHRTPVTLNTGSGNDIVNVGGSSNSLDGLLGPLTVNGNKTTVLNIHDQGATADKTYNVTGGEFTRGSAQQPAVITERIAYSSLGGLVVRGGIGTSTFYVASTPAGTAVTLYGGIAPPGAYIYDQFIIGSFSTLDSIQGPLALHGQTSLSYPLLSDSQNPVGHTYTLTADRIRRTGMADITFDGMVQMILYTSLTGADTVNVESVATNVFTPIALGNGDKITLGQPVEGGRTLQDIRGTVRPQLCGNGPVAVVVDNSGDTNPHQATFTYDPAIVGAEHVLNGLAPAPIYFGLDAAASLLVKGGIGNDSFRLPTSLPTVSLKLDGGGGTNTLDYSAFTTGVLVNLQAGNATAAPGGIVNFADVTGGAGDDILIGNDLDNVLTGNGGNDLLLGLGGNDKLYGGIGRDILIGGLGSDLLEGGAGDDVLIGGYTDFDTQVDSAGTVSHNINQAALDAIMREWTRNDLNSLGGLESYKARVDHLLSGIGGLNGSTALKSNGKNATVHSDGASDVMTGGDGFDWFFATKKEDTVTDSLNQEKAS